MEIGSVVYAGHAPPAIMLPARTESGHAFWRIHFHFRTKSLTLLERDKVRASNHFDAELKTAAKKWQDD
jgi:hypothetical protein